MRSIFAFILFAALSICFSSASYGASHTLVDTDSVQSIANKTYSGSRLIATSSNSFANCSRIGEASNYYCIWNDSVFGLLLQCVIGDVQNACDYYRQLASGYKWGIKDHSGNVLLQMGEDGKFVLNLGSDATGDMYYRDSNGNFVRLGIGGATTLLHGGTIPAFSAIVGADLPTPTTSVFGGVKDLAAVATNLLDSVVNGVPHARALVAADIPTTSSAVSSGSVSVTGPRQYLILTTTSTVTVPVPVLGYEFCIMNNVAVSTVITLAALGSSAMYGKTDQSGYGTAGTGTLISGGATGDKICLLGKDSTHYNVISYNGTWTAN